MHKKSSDFVLNHSSTMKLTLIVLIILGAIQVSIAFVKLCLPNLPCIYFPPVPKICGEYVPYKQYSIIPFKVDQDTASAFCDAFGWELATVMSQQEMDTLCALAQQDDPTNPAVWLAGQNSADDFVTFRWPSTGIPVDECFDPWNDGEPNNGQLAATILYPNIKKFNDELRTYLSVFACQRPG